MKKINIIKKSEDVQNILEKTIEYENFKKLNIFTHNSYYDDFLYMIDKYNNNVTLFSNIISTRFQDVLDYIIPVLATEGDTKHTVNIKPKKIIYAIIRRNLIGGENMWQTIGVPKEKLSKIRGIKIPYEKKSDKNVTIYQNVSTKFSLEDNINFLDIINTGMYNIYDIELDNTYVIDNLIKHGLKLIGLKENIFIFSGDSMDSISELILNFKMSMIMIRNNSTIPVYVYYNNKINDIIEYNKLEYTLNTEILNYPKSVITFNDIQKKIDSISLNKMLIINDFSFNLSLFFYNLFDSYYGSLFFGDVYLNNLLNMLSVKKNDYDSKLKQLSIKYKELLKITTLNYISKKNFNEDSDDISNNQRKILFTLYEKYINDMNKDNVDKVPKNVYDIVDEYKNVILNYDMINYDKLTEIYNKLTSICNLELNGNDYIKYDTVIGDKTNNYQVICPHLLLKGKYYLESKTREDILNHDDKIKEIYGLKSNDLNYFCKICGEVIFQDLLINETMQGLQRETNIDIIMESSDEDTLDHIIITRIISVVQDSVKFSFNINTNTFYKTISLMIENIIIKINIHIQESKVDTKKDKENKINLFLVFYIYSALIFMIINDKSNTFYFDGLPLTSADKEQDKSKKTISIMLNFCIGKIMSSTYYSSIINNLGYSKENIAALFFSSFNELKNINYNISEFEVMKKKQPYYFYFINDTIINFFSLMCLKINENIYKYIPNAKYILEPKDEIKKFDILEDIKIIEKEKFVKTKYDDIIYDAFKLSFELLVNKYYNEFSVNCIDSPSIKNHLKNILIHNKKILDYIFGRKLKFRIPFFDYKKRDKKIYTHNTGDIYDENGFLHNYKIYIYKSKKDDKTIEIHIDDIKNWIKKKEYNKLNELNKNFTNIDKKCIICNKLRSSKGEEFNIQNILKNKLEISSFYAYFENRCPKGRLHEFEKEICKKCGLSRNDFKKKYHTIKDEYYIKYKEEYNKLRLIGEKLIVEEYINKNKKYELIFIDKHDRKSIKIDINNDDVIYLSKNLSVPYNVLINIGLYDGYKYIEIKNNEKNPQKYLSIDEKYFAIDKLRNYVLMLRILLVYLNSDQKGRNVNIIVDKFVTKFGKKYDIRLVTIKNVLLNFFKEEYEIDTNDLKTYLPFLINKLFSTLRFIYDNIENKDLSNIFTKFLVDYIVDCEIMYCKPLANAAKLSAKDSEYDLRSVDDDDYEQNNENESKQESGDFLDEQEADDLFSAKLDVYQEKDDMDDEADINETAADREL